ncbi:MAG TPA: DUF2231 domain-containing protein [Longimicrobiales bacterium]
MLPDPLHPMVVHFPIVLVVLLPFFAVGALLMIRRGSAPRRIWALPLLVAAALVASAFVALRTGEAEEDRVERIVSEDALHAHEEAAERFVVLAGVLLLVATAGLAGGALGTAARGLTAAGALGLVIAGVQVGRAGGELVYEHGAANAYVDAQTAAQPGMSARPERDGDDDD